MVNIRLFWKVLLCAGASAVLSASAASGDVGYAPPETDLIIRVNGPQICRSRLFAPIRKDSRFVKVEKDMHGDLVKLGLTIDDLLDTDLFVFISANRNRDSERPCFDMVARNGKPLADKALVWLDDQVDPDDGEVFENKPVDGKPARLLKDEDISRTLIALEKDLLQLSVNSSHRALTPQMPPAFAGAMQPEAMISLACRLNGIADEELCKQLPPMIAPFALGVGTATLNVLDGGDEIRINAELGYPEPERAKAVRAQLKYFLFAMAMSLAEKRPDKVAVLRKIRVSGRGQIVTIRFSCRYDELVNVLFLIK